VPRDYGAEGEKLLRQRREDFKGIKTADKGIHWFLWNVALAYSSFRRKAFRVGFVNLSSSAATAVRIHFRDDDFSKRTSSFVEIYFQYFPFTQLFASVRQTQTSASAFTLSRGNIYFFELQDTQIKKKLRAELKREWFSWEEFTICYSHVDWLLSKGLIIGDEIKWDGEASASIERKQQKWMIRRAVFGLRVIAA
jgi:hypothetical protein